MKDDAALSEAVERYRRGEPVPTRDVAGLGAAYELVTQCLLWESLCLLADGAEPHDSVHLSASAFKSLAFSGAQVAAVLASVRDIYTRGLLKWLPKATSKEWRLHARWWPDCPFPPGMPG